MSISGNLIGSYSQMGKTFIIQDENGNEITAVVTEQAQIFTATDNDVRKGFVYASDSGVSTGTKDIPIYRTRAGSYMVFPGDSFSVPISEYDGYNYTVFQCMVSIVNLENMNNSVNTSMIAFNNGVYEVNSTNLLSSVSPNTSTQSIDLNITNNSDDIYFIHYFTYKEEE